MSTIRPALAATSQSFGRRARGFVADEPLVASARGSDARLFAFTFLGGFLFMTVYLA
ncbi:MAG: hypothetical protein V4696_10540 [Pseudomonadota bacterium]